MAKIDRVMVGESLVGDGNEVAHIDLILGPRGSAAESAFTNALTNNKDGFTSLLAVVAPNLMCKPATVMFNKVTIKGAKQAVQMFGPAQRAVAMAVADSVEDGTIPASEADDIFVVLEFSFTGKLRMIRKSRTTTIRQPRKLLSAQFLGSQLHLKLFQVKVHRHIHLLPKWNWDMSAIFNSRHILLFWDNSGT